MKKLYTSLVLTLIVITTFAQTPNISMTTTLSINSQITIGLSGNASSTPIQIDWGNGVKENFTIGTSEEFFGYPVKGSNIKIWGTGITGLNIQSKSITALDFYETTNLKWLFCKNNQITTLNLSGCSALTFVECNQNLISNLTLPTTTTLTYVDCSDNNLTLASLPLKQGSWTTYIYSPQKDYTLSKNIYAVNDEIDLSSQITINGNSTNYTWITASGSTLVNGVDFNVTGGKFAFLKTYSEKIYCEMRNATFPNIIIRTIPISILTLPAIEMTTNSIIDNYFSLILRSDVENTSAYVDWGDGNLTYYNIITSNSLVYGLLKSNTIKIFCERIIYIDVISKNLSSINISNCSTLKYLFCNNNQLTSIDLSKNTSILNLNCSFNNLTTLDVSKNKAIANLNCNNNKISFLDVTENTALTKLYCSSNQLTSLNLSNNVSLTEINCSSNLLTFTTLPIKQPSWTLYSYGTQSLYRLPKKNYALNEEIDLSSQLTANNNTTNYTWKTKGGKTLIAGSDYNESNGIFNFTNGLNDSIYCEMRNSSFPDLILNTSAIILPQTPKISMATLNAIGSSLTFIIRSDVDYTNVKVDWGDGNLTSYNIYTTNSYIDGVLKGSTIKIFGEGIMYLDVMSKNLSTIDVSNCSSLKYLFVKGNKLSNIDVTKNTSLIRLNICDNLISNIDITKNTMLLYLDCYNNRLSTIDVSKNTVLISLDCYSNQLTFNTLPIKSQSWSTYNYSPQAKILLDKKTYNISETVDLSSQLTSNGNTTSYKWKTKGGITLTSGTDYSVTGGVTTFLKGQTDSVYCQMTNATFPGLTISTTNIKVSDPTSIDSEFSQTTKVYPNPVSNLLWVVSEEAIKKVEIYTVVGTKVFEQDYYASQKANINTAEFPKGLLIIKVYGMNGVMEKKILKE